VSDGEAGIRSFALAGLGRGTALAPDAKIGALGVDVHPLRRENGGIDNMDATLTPSFFVRAGCYFVLRPAEAATTTGRRGHPLSDPLTLTLTPRDPINGGVLLAAAPVEELIEDGIMEPPLKHRREVAVEVSPPGVEYAGVNGGGVARSTVSCVNGSTQTDDARSHSSYGRSQEIVGKLTPLARGAGKRVQRKRSKPPPGEKRRKRRRRTKPDVAAAGNGARAPERLEQIKAGSADNRRAGSLTTAGKPEDCHAGLTMMHGESKETNRTMSLW